MGEVAFRVKPGSDLYNHHFAEKAERQKLHEFAREFFKKNGFNGTENYIYCEVNCRLKMAGKCCYAFIPKRKYKGKVHVVYWW